MAEPGTSLSPVASRVLDSGPTHRSGHPDLPPGHYYADGPQDEEPDLAFKDESTGEMIYFLNGTAFYPR